MSASAGPGSLDQSINVVQLTDFAQSIDFTSPKVICICIIIFVGVFFVVIKIEDKKTAGIVRKEGINAYHIGTIVFNPKEMLPD